MNIFTLGTRGSALALAQADITIDLLRHAWPEMAIERKIFITRGDQKLDLNLLTKGDAGGKGLFTRELEDALLSGAIDVAVHSLKDLPGNNPAGLEIVAVLERAPVSDVMVSKLPGGLDGLPEGASVGTSSVRRARQIQWLRPDIKIEEWRGNVPTRLRKLDQREDVDAIVLAEAGLRRLGYKIDFDSGVLTWPEGKARVHSLADKLLPAIGQGAIALQARSDRKEVCDALSAINHEATMTSVRAERELQRLLSGDCSLPVGVRSEIKNGVIKLDGILFFNDSLSPLVAVAEGPANEPEAVAQKLFNALS